MRTGRSASAHHTPSDSPKIGDRRVPPSPRPDKRVPASPRPEKRVPASPRPGARPKSRPGNNGDQQNPPHQAKFGLSYVIKPGGSSKESGYDSENSSTHHQEELSYRYSSVPGKTVSRNMPTHTKQKGFSEWMKHRQESLEKMSSQDKSLEQCRVAGGGGSEQRAGSVLDRVELDTGDMSDYTVSASSASTTSHRRKLQPQQFDDLADKIIRRVKSELNLNNISSSSGIKKTSVNGGGEAESDSGVHVDSSDITADRKGLNGHYCAGCKKLMVSQMLIEKSALITYCLGIK